MPRQRHHPGAPHRIGWNRKYPPGNHKPRGPWQGLWIVFLVWKRRRWGSSPLCSFGSQGKSRIPLRKDYWSMSKSPATKHQKKSLLANPAVLSRTLQLKVFPQELFFLQENRAVTRSDCTKGPGWPIMTDLFSSFSKSGFVVGLSLIPFAWWHWRGYITMVSL